MNTPPADISPDTPGWQVAQVEMLVDDIEVEAGEVLTREGRYESQSFIIVSDEADVTRGAQLLGTLGAGDFFGEIAMLAGPKRVETVTAVTSMYILVLDPGSFSTLLEDGEVARVILRRLVERLRGSEAARVEGKESPMPVTRAGDR